MPIQRNKPTNDPEIKVIRACCQCGGAWNIPMPVKSSPKQDAKSIPDVNGRGYCWRCYEVKHPHWSDVKVTGMARV